MVKKQKSNNKQKKGGDNCFQYALTVALGYEKIGDHPERICNIRPFITKCNWEYIDFPSHQKDWKKFEQNNKTIALNILNVLRNTKQIRLAYKSKQF